MNPDNNVEWRVTGVSGGGGALLACAPQKSSNQGCPSPWLCRNSILSDIIKGPIEKEGSRDDRY